jgi:hypothetical protein
LLVFFSESEWSQVAYVTFKDSQGADTAVLLSVCSSSWKSFSNQAFCFYVLPGCSFSVHAISSHKFILVQETSSNHLIPNLQGATIVDRAVVITPAENYQLPPEALKQLQVRMYLTH